MIRLLEVTARTKGLVLQLNTGGELPTRIVADPVRLRQVVANLVGNAIKFTHAGDVNVHLACDAQTAQLRISVRDTGIGIPAEKQKSILMHSPRPTDRLRDSIEALASAWRSRPD